MARPRKTPSTAAQFDPKALDALIGDAKSPAEVDELFRQMKQVLMERILWRSSGRFGRRDRGVGQVSTATARWTPTAEKR